MDLYLLYDKVLIDRVTQSWYATVQRALIKDIQVLFVYEEDSSHGPMFGLYNVELTTIKPNYEAMIKQGQLKVTDMGIATGESNCFKKSSCLVPEGVGRHIPVHLWTRVFRPVGFFTHSPP